MPFQLQGKSASIVEVGGAGFNAANTHFKPLEFKSQDGSVTLGHYRVNHRTVLLAAQAANSRLFSFRNTGTSLCVTTRLVVKWFQTAAHTAMIEDSLDVFRVTGFTVSPTTNSVALTPSVKRTSMALAANAIGKCFGVAIAGAAGGMTGDTLTKDGTSIGQLPLLLALAAPTSGVPSVLDVFDDVNGTHPLVFAQNEGFEIENRVLLGAAAGSSVYVDHSWAEVVAF